MLIVSFFSWWYGRGWKQVFDSFGPRLQNIADTFSVKQLSRTLFAPWKRIISYPGASLGERLRAWGDNLFSRCIGFVVRMGVLVAALIATIFTTVFTAVELAAWPLFPLAIPVLLLAGLLG